jgi:hypothetical protein
VAAIALFLAIGGSAAAATGMFSGSQIQPNSIPLNRLTGDARQALNQSGPRGQQGAQGDDGQTGDRGKQGADGDRGAAGSKGAAGATGATGATGLTGAAGAQGAAGADGTQGPAGDIGPQGLVGPAGAAGAAGADPNRLSQVSSLDSNIAVAAPAWAAATGKCGTDPAGTASIDASGLEIGAPASTGLDGFGGAQYNPPSGIPLSDITALSYTERYEGATTSNAPYLEIDLVDNTSLDFIPSAQPAGSVASGTWATWDVVAPTASYNTNHSGHTAFSAVLAAHGTVAVKDIQVEAGCINGTAASTSTISSVVLDAGSQVQSFRFGS